MLVSYTAGLSFRLIFTILWYIYLHLHLKWTSKILLVEVRCQKWTQIEWISACCVGVTCILAEVKEGNHCDLLSVIPLRCLNLTHTHTRTSLFSNSTNERQPEVCQMLFSAPWYTDWNISCALSCMCCFRVNSGLSLADVTQSQRFHGTDTC